jgi:DNA (cytosine-5)-methyltransferase 1
MMLRVLDLFSGIGGFSLGLERTGGFKTVAFCEIEPFPRKVLAKHWPKVPCYHDIRELTANRLAADGIGVDLICGGFPCQDISTAGKGAGMAGERSGLWSEYARLIGELRPQFVIVENVSALLSRGLADVLGDLAALGYDAEWHCIPASAVGAPHRRDRIWIVAYPFSNGCYNDGSRALRHKRDALSKPITLCQPGIWAERRDYVADANGSRLKERWEQWQLTIQPTQNRQWSVEPDVGRVANGVPSRVDRLKGLGNAVVPQIPELIGRAILAAGT